MQYTEREAFTTTCISIPRTKFIAPAGCAGQERNASKIPRLGKAFQKSEGLLSLNNHKRLQQPTSRPKNLRTERRLEFWGIGVAIARLPIKEKVPSYNLGRQRHLQQPYSSRRFCKLCSYFLCLVFLKAMVRCVVRRAKLP